jgi:hypothetical protein
MALLVMRVLLSVATSQFRQVLSHQMSQGMQRAVLFH